MSARGRWAPHAVFWHLKTRQGVFPRTMKVANLARFGIGSATGHVSMLLSSVQTWCARPGHRGIPPKMRRYGASHHATSVFNGKELRSLTPTIVAKFAKFG